MIVGEGRAGKSAFANTIIGRPYTDTESTVGINQMTCDIKYASIGSGNGWSEHDKPTKELETAIANMIANGLDPDDLSKKEIRSIETDMKKVDVTHEESHSLEAYSIKQRLKKDVKSSVMTSIDKASDHGFVARIDDATTAERAVGKYMDEAHKGVEEAARVEISDSEVNAFDNELVMKCLADKVQTESKFIISVFDFGGQSVFNVRYDEL